MFLRQLNNKQKVLVLELAKKAAAANGIVDESEERLIKGFVDEMGEVTLDNVSGNLELESLCKELVLVSSRKELIQVTFEILGIMYADTEYDTEEKTFMRNVAESFAIPESGLIEMEKCVTDYAAVVSRMNKLLEQ